MNPLWSYSDHLGKLFGGQSQCQSPVAQVAAKRAPDGRLALAGILALGGEWHGQQSNCPCKEKLPIGCHPSFFRPLS
jgi:hypothetical protein